MKTYRIWAYIEEHDEETDVACAALGLPEMMIGLFPTLTAAMRCLEELHGRTRDERGYD